MATTKKATNTTTPPNNPPPKPSSVETTPPSPLKSNKRLLPTLAVLTLVLGLSVGLHLISQSQDPRSQAGDHKCSSDSTAKICQGKDVGAYCGTTEAGIEKQCRKHSGSTNSKGEYNCLCSPVVTGTLCNFDSVKDCQGKKVGSSCNDTFTCRKLSGEADPNGNYRCRCVENESPTATPAPGGFAPECNSWQTMNINGCTLEGWQTEPKAQECITDNSLVTLNHSSPDAIEMRLFELKPEFLQENPEFWCKDIDPHDINWSEWTNYLDQSSFQLTYELGNHKVCAQYQNSFGSSPICGGLITLTDNFTPTTTPAPDSCEYFNEPSCSGDQQCLWYDCTLSPEFSSCNAKELDLGISQICCPHGDTYSGGVGQGECTQDQELIYTCQGDGYTTHCAYTNEPPCPSLDTAPQNLNPSGIISACGLVSMEFTWDEVPGASHYLVYINDLTNDWNSECDTNPDSTLPGDTCTTTDNPSFYRKIEPGQSYVWWVYAMNECGSLSPRAGISEPFSSPICINTPTPTPGTRCEIYCLDGFYLTDDCTCEPIPNWCDGYICPSGMMMNDECVCTPLVITTPPPDQLCEKLCLDGYYLTPDCTCEPIPGQPDPGDGGLFASLFPNLFASIFAQFLGLFQDMFGNLQ